jgi:hypothetical protein
MQKLELKWFCPNCGSTEVKVSVGQRVEILIGGLFLIIFGAFMILYGFGMAGTGSPTFLMGTLSTTGTFIGSIWTLLGFLLLIGGIYMVSRSRNKFEG